MDADLEKLFQLEGTAFELKRKEILENYFQSLGSNEQRARAMQWALEKRLDKIKHPQARFQVMQLEFWKQFAKFRDALREVVKE